MFGQFSTILCDNDPIFLVYRIAQWFGLPVVPEWAGWFNEELKRHGAIQAILGLRCSPVLVRGSKKLFLKWIGKALRQKRVAFPESNGPVRWSVACTFFRISENGLEDESPQEVRSESLIASATRKGELCVSY
jgi:hypothetical protein